MRLLDPAVGFDFGNALGLAYFVLLFVAFFERFEHMGGIPVFGIVVLDVARIDVVQIDQPILIILLG